MQWSAKGLAATVVAVFMAGLFLPAAVPAANTRGHRAASRCAHVVRTRAGSRAKRCRKPVRRRRTTQWSSKRREPDQNKRLRHAKAATATAGWNVLSNPIDSREQSALPFGTRSDWLQPWRAYLDTQPASMLRDALGINFNVDPQYAASTAQFLSGVGFKRAR